MKKKLIFILLMTLAGSTQAASKVVTLHEVNDQGIGNAIGKVTISETPYGLKFSPELTGLESGIHGFHVHANGSCEPAKSGSKNIAAGTAGGHFDPEGTGQHLGPYGEGHLGDLPALYVAADGQATYPVVAPRLKSIHQITGKALMVHAGGDNHSDKPHPLGGGGIRVACGVI
ncbi:superoxide dismutase family protein [Erwinia tracheiphila]|uniref:Superoxide dismutase [Cu-Zn] n=1 Tax=Erwinia tracheiphila TaxID=65700 RepID=A0A0M2KBK1_9GAMM|nr:superoxide dismutase family protein [Erwinia tracheiphila]AXF75832.1 superoxide dismutase [Cu-Zn] SodC2 [Erwinia tracheiphila]KKF34618.1 superoxide dismutase [Erwinia tracheiphila]UIA85516.1 superoxide dismutase family protein [Erwinia tracheiphila]UIA86291.1 superoxide dismutase family protein [Erwinia tracheiphila]UIA94037.1 superoxide dismutase family protein [Erwinia tracheiphila]